MGSGFEIQLMFHTDTGTLNCHDYTTIPISK